MDMESYLNDLTAQLQRRGVDEERIRQIIVEVEGHLTESGESPVEAFGPAARYAEEMTAFAEQNAENSTPDKWHNRTFRATAIDEMEILKGAGQEGWELVDVGALALFCRRPEDLTQAHRWEYKRRTGTHRHIIKEEMARGQWEPCGNWIVFHYFKRKKEILESL